MNKKSVFASPAILYTLSFFATILAIMIVYVCFLDDFSHSFLFLFLYILLFALIIAVDTAFKKGRKEIVKAGAASLFTTCFFFHTMGFVDMLSLNYYYFFSGNFVATCIGFIAVLLFIFFVIAYINHFVINATNDSETKKVKTNKTLLIIIAVLSLIQAALIAYNDSITGRNIEFYLILTYAMFFFISLILVSIETLINEFRIAREMGTLNTYTENLVGKKAANAALGKPKANKIIKKTIKKSTKK